jgi:hypothetical protein
MEGSNMFQNDVYYRLLYLNDEVTIVCMQDFDEYDYDENKFIKDEKGEWFKFDTEEAAEVWLNTHVKRNKIDPKYRNIPKDIFL